MVEGVYIYCGIMVYIKPCLRLFPIPSLSSWMDGVINLFYGCSRGLSSGEPLELHDMNVVEMFNMIIEKIQILR